MVEVAMMVNAEWCRFLLSSYHVPTTHRKTKCNMVCCYGIDLCPPMRAQYRDRSGPMRVLQSGLMWSEQRWERRETDGEEIKPGDCWLTADWSPRDLSQVNQPRAKTALQSLITLGQTGWEIFQVLAKIFGTNTWKYFSSIGKYFELFKTV